MIIDYIDFFFNIIRLGLLAAGIIIRDGCFYFMFEKKENRKRTKRK